MSFKNYGIYTIFGDYKVPKPKQYIEHFDNDELNPEKIIEHASRRTMRGRGGGSSQGGSNRNNNSKPQPQHYLITNGKGGANVNWSSNVGSHTLNGEEIIDYFEDLANQNDLKFSERGQKETFIKKLLNKLFDGNHCHIHAVHIDTENGIVRELKARGRTNGNDAYQLENNPINNRMTLILNREGYNIGAIADPNSNTYNASRQSGVTTIDFSERQELMEDILKMEGTLMGLKLAIETCQENAV